MEREAARATLRRWAIVLACTLLYTALVCTLIRRAEQRHAAHPHKAHMPASKRQESK